MLNEKSNNGTNILLFVLTNILFPNFHFTIEFNDWNKFIIYAIYMINCSFINFDSWMLKLFVN